MRKFYNIGNGDLKVSRLSTKEAATSLVERLNNPSHDDYFLSDKDLGVKYKLKTAMVKKIREASDIPIREDRILRVLRTLDTQNMFMDRILLELKDRVTYNTLYVLMRNNGIPFLRKNKINSAPEEAES